MRKEREEMGAIPCTIDNQYNPLLRGYHIWYYGKEQYIKEKPQIRSVGIRILVMVTCHIE
jgi:hypothetical protein